MDQSQDEHQPGTPAMEYLQSFVGDARYHTNEVELGSQESTIRISMTFYKPVSAAGKRNHTL